jgi:hypothetical protein
LVVVVSLAVVAVLGLGALAGVAVLGVNSIKSRSTTSTAAARTTDLAPATTSPIGRPSDAVEVTCSPSTPESQSLITQILAPPASALIESRSYTSGSYEVLIAQLVDAKARGLAPAMWMIEDGVPYAASSAATAYSGDIEDLTYEVNQGFRKQTGLDLQTVADALGKPCGIN